MSTHVLNLTINGRHQTVEVPSRLLLGDLIRDRLHLTGTKRGCETGVCGACSVIVDGEVVKSCLQLAVRADGRDITLESSGQPRRTASAAAGLPDLWRPAVRLLYARLPDDGDGPARPTPESVRRRDPDRTERQSLPLHRYAQIVESIQAATSPPMEIERPSPSPARRTTSGRSCSIRSSWPSACPACSRST